MMDIKSILGYAHNSPFRNAPYLDIQTPGGLISMENTDIDLMGVDNYGNTKKMKAGTKKPYKFKGTTVREIPMQTGGVLAGVKQTFKEPEGPIGYLNSYYDSDTFKDRFIAAGHHPEDYSRLTQSMAEGRNAYSAEVVSKYRNLGSHVSGNKIILDESQGKRLGVNMLNEVLPHEYSHLTRTRNFTSVDESNFVNKLGSGETTRAFRGMFDSYLKNTPADTFSNYLSKLSVRTHDMQPDENYSDLNSLRYNMYRRGIYDTRKGNMTMDDFKKAQNDPEIKKGFILGRLLKNYTPEEIVELNNTVASTNQNQSSRMQMGGALAAANAEAKRFAISRGLIMGEDAHVDRAPSYIDGRTGLPYQPFPTRPAAYTVPNEVQLNDIQEYQGKYWYNDPKTGDLVDVDPSVVNLPRFRKAPPTTANMTSYVASRKKGGSVYDNPYMQQGGYGPQQLLSYLFSDDNDITPEHAEEAQLDEQAQEELQQRENDVVDGDNDLAMQIAMGSDENESQNMYSNPYSSAVGNQKSYKGFKTFASYEDGKNALIGQLELYKTGRTRNNVKPNSTLYEAMSVYAPAGDNNNPKQYAESIAKRLGISVNTPISAINTEQWAAAIEKMEGNRYGNNPGNLRQ